VALLDLMLIADELASGALIQPFGPVLPGYRCFLVYPEPAADSEKIAAVRSWIRRELRSFRRPSSRPISAAPRPRNSVGAR